MSRAGHRAEWQAARLYAAAEDALKKVQRGELERAMVELVRVEGIAIQARQAVRAAIDETVRKEAL